MTVRSKLVIMSIFPHAPAEPDDSTTGAEKDGRGRGNADSQMLRVVVKPEQLASGEPNEVAALKARLHRLERQNRWIKLSTVLVLALTVLFAAKTFLPPDTIVRQTLMESKELKLLDNDGHPRLFLRMYSRVPVLQLLDANGKPRMSLGLRFDDTPFLDLSDKTGSTRASIQLSPEGEPVIELFDENGESSTRIR